MDSSEEVYWPEKVLKAMETEERKRLSTLQSTLNTESLEALTAFELRLFPAISDLLDQVSTAQTQSKAGEYFLAAKPLLVAYRPMLLDSACDIQVDRLVFRNWPGSPSANCLLQQVFYQATQVIKAQELVARMKSGLQGLAAQEIVRYTEETLAELPICSKFRVLFARTDREAEPCNLLASATYDLLSQSIAALCEVKAYSEALPFRIQANRLFAQRIPCESHWGLSTSEDLISPKARYLYESAVSANTEDGYQKALDYWYLLEPLGSTTYRLLERLGDLYFRKKDETQAILTYRKAELVIQYDPYPAISTVLVLLRLAQLERKLHFAPIITVKSLQMALRICGLHPPNPSLLLDVLYSLAKSYSDAGCASEAESAFEQCLSLMQSPPCHQVTGVFFHFAKQQVKSKHYSEAESLFHQALSDIPSSLEEFSAHDIYTSLVELYSTWKPELVEKTLFSALSAALNDRHFCEWCEKLTSFFRLKAREKEESVVVFMLKRDDRLQYRKYQALRITRELYR